MVIGAGVGFGAVSDEAARETFDVFFDVLLDGLFVGLDALAGLALTALVVFTGTAVVAAAGVVVAPESVAP